MLDLDIVLPPLSDTPHPKRLLFNHLPKCGGSSLIRYLIPHYSKRRIFLINGGNPQRSIDLFTSLPKATRYTFELIIGHAADRLFSYIHPDFIRATMLRDPIDRIISHYYYVKRTPAHHLHDKLHRQKMDLADYVSSSISVELTNWYILHFTKLSLEEAESDPDTAIELAYNNIVDNHHIIGFMDDYDCFTDRLYKEAYLTFKYDNTKLNVSYNKKEREQISDSEIEAIKEFNQLDIALYKKLKADVG